MVKCYRKSVALSDLWVSSNERISDFYTSSWQRGDSPLPMLVIRIILTTMSLATLVWSLVEGSRPQWLAFLTNWGLLLVNLTMLSGTVTSIMCFCKTPAVHLNVSESKKLPWYAATYWFFFNVSTSIAVLITALYWTLLYDPDPKKYVAQEFWLNIFTHGMNSCIMVAVLVTSRTPVRALHVYQPFGVGLWYAAFSAIYYAAGGTDGDGNPFIYEVLDWRQGWRAGTTVSGSLVGIVIVYAMLWGTALCRDKLSSALVRTTSNELVPPDKQKNNTVPV